MAFEKKRYYVHGDRHEENLLCYYCAECDLFVDEDHFMRPHREGHNARYQAAAKKISKHMKSSKEYFRPSGSENIFS